MATDGFAGSYIETRNYGATAAFWKSLGFQSMFETDHGSGQWVHPSGGPYVFIAETHEGELERTRSSRSPTRPDSHASAPQTSSARSSPSTGE